ncbi:hypothetical protein JYT96_00490 [Gammaproteobacteria bacterium AH-315-C21]|nr:hypothetical protein [Gammaproteobacteria bacterium AH-315-C21]
MIEVRDIPPINPVVPKKSVIKKEQQQQSNGRKKKSAEKQKRDRYGRGHIDEFA